MNVLVVAAHPDDEVLGCGGTIARLAAEGHAVAIAILGEGSTSRAARRESADPGPVVALAEATRAAGKRLGAMDTYAFGLPDNRFDTVPLLDVVKLVEDLVTRVEPEVLYTHHGGDLNVDHAITARACLTATRPTGARVPRAVYAFEVPSSTEWSFAALAPAFRPSVFVDVAATLEAKLAAMACYADEMRPFPHPRSAEALTAAARRWGSVAGLAAAEAFELIREIR